jgi:hypothetical protein
MSSPVSELDRRCSANPSSSQGPQISTSVYASSGFQRGSNGRI